MSINEETLSKSFGLGTEVLFPLPLLSLLPPHAPQYIPAGSVSTLEMKY